jgi:hypothetical protein
LPNVNHSGVSGFVEMSQISQLNVGPFEPIETAMMSI